MSVYTESRYPSKYHTGLKVYEPPKCFKDEYDSFMHSLKLRCLKDSTLYVYSRDCTFILTSFFEKGITSLQDITLQMVTDSYKQSTNKPSFRKTTKLFFDHLIKIGLVKTNFAMVLPILRKPQKVPSVYTQEETDKLLNAIDREAVKGKRDYAMILLALRLGLRNSDVINLKFSNINFRESFLDFTQFKTSVPHRLNMPISVKEALEDYINNGRASSDEEYIFLSDRSSKLPLHPGAFTSVINRYMIKAGIDWGDRHHGPHALRSTFASELLAEKVPYDAIRVILGHTNPGNVRFYTKMSIEDLRTCALEVPPPSGLFAKYLSGASI